MQKIELDVSNQKIRNPETGHWLSIKKDKAQALLASLNPEELQELFRHKVYPAGIPTGEEKNHPIPFFMPTNPSPFLQAQQKGKPKRSPTPQKQKQKPKTPFPVHVKINHVDDIQKKLQQIQSKCVNKQGKDYQIGPHIASGSYGSVFRLCQKQNCTYVIKISLVSPDLRKTLQEEIAIQRHLTEYGIKHRRFNAIHELCPSLIDTWDCKWVDSEQDLNFIVSTLYDGTLEKLWESQKLENNRFAFLTQRQLTLIVTLIRQLTQAGVIHGDLHEGNILFKNMPNNLHQFAVTDFGFSTWLKSKEETIQNWEARRKNDDLIWNYYLCDVEATMSLEDLWDWRDSLNWIQLEYTLCRLRYWKKKPTTVVVSSAPNLQTKTTNDQIFMGFYPSLYDKIGPKGKTLGDFLGHCHDQRKLFQDHILNDVMNPPAKLGDRVTVTVWNLEKQELQSQSFLVQEDSEESLFIF